MKTFTDLTKEPRHNLEEERYLILETKGDYTLIYRYTSFQPWVVAWLYRENSHWEQGHYFDEFSDAVEYFLVTSGKRNENRMIDADKLIENFKNTEDAEYSKWTLSGIIDEIENTIEDVA